METAAATKDVQLVLTVAKLLSRHPEAVTVTRTIDDLGVLLTLQVHPEDMASIIGREGRAAKALRTLLRVVGAQNNERVNLKIAEPVGAAPRDEYAPDETVDTDTSYHPAEPTESTPPTSSFVNLDDIPEPLA